MTQHTQQSVKYSSLPLLSMTMVRLSELSEHRNLMESSLPPHLKILIRLCVCDRRGWDGCNRKETVNAPGKSNQPC